jgi:hypothetical protein
MFRKWKATAEIMISCDWEIPEESNLKDSDAYADITLRTEIALNEMGRITIDNGIPVNLRFHIKDIAMKNGSKSLLPRTWSKD